MVVAWKLEPSAEPPTSPHKKTPDEPVDLKSLEKFGMFCKSFKHPEDISYKDDPALLAFCKDNDYTSSDILTVSREGLKNYEETLKCFFNEHFHPDDESRYVLDGAGYFDVRNENDEWVRVRIEKGDLITLPAGMYHRFALDDQQSYLKSVRMFVSDAIWTPLFRPNEDHFIRKEYLKKYNIDLPPV